MDGEQNRVSTVIGDYCQWLAKLLLGFDGTPPVCRVVCFALTLQNDRVLDSWTMGRGHPLLRPPPKALLTVRGTLRSALLSLTLGLLSSLGCVTLCEQFVSALYNVALNKRRDTGGIRYHGNLDDMQVAGLAPQ